MTRVYLKKASAYRTLDSLARCPFFQQLWIQNSDAK